VTPFVAIGITNTVAVDYFKTSREALSRHIATSLLLSLGIVCVFFVLIIGFQNPLESYFHVPLLLLLAIPLLCFFNLVIDLAFILLRNENQVKKVTIATILRTVLELATSVGFIILLLWGWQGRLYSLVLASALAFVGGMVYLFKKYELSWQFDVAFLKKEWRYWIATMVSFCFVISFTSIDKYIIKNLCTPLELGDYSLATQFGFIVIVFYTALSSAYTPNLFKDLSDKKGIKFIYKKILLLSIGLIFISILSIFLVFIFMKYYVNDRYSGAWKLYYYVAIVYCLWCILMLNYNVLNFFKLNNILLKLGISSILFFIPFQYFFVRAMGINGLFLAQIIYICASIIYIININIKSIKSDV
jgi:O-antigen/teichoic acid export membrane protein